MFQRGIWQTEAAIKKTPPMYFINEDRARPKDRRSVCEVRIALVLRWYRRIHSDVYSRNASERGERHLLLPKEKNKKMRKQ